MQAISQRRGLYAIVDPELCLGRDPLAVAVAILGGGCAVLQLRAKRMAEPELELLARGMLQACSAHGVPFVVNDRPELALRVGAAGVHLGQADMPIAQARGLLGSALAIGLSTHDLAQARSAQRAGADLIGFGPIFATASKRDPDPVVGVDGLQAVCRTVSIPVVAIGGITQRNAAEVAATGVAMAAAIGAVCGAESPRAAAAGLHAELSRGRGVSGSGSGAPRR